MCVSVVVPGVECHSDQNARVEQNASNSRRYRFGKRAPISIVLVAYSSPENGSGHVNQSRRSQEVADKDAKNSRSNSDELGKIGEDGIAAFKSQNAGTDVFNYVMDSPADP